MLLTEESLSADVKRAAGNILKQYTLDTLQQIYWNESTATTTNFENTLLFGFPDNCVYQRVIVG
jgi:hypothetical protein